MNIKLTLAFSVIVLFGVSIPVFDSLTSNPVKRDSPPEGFAWENFYDAGYNERDTPKSVAAARPASIYYETDRMLFVLGESYHTAGGDIQLRAIDLETGKQEWIHKPETEPGTRSAWRYHQDNSLCLDLDDDHIFMLTGINLSKLSKIGGDTVWETQLPPRQVNKNSIGGRVLLSETGEVFVAQSIHSKDYWKRSIQISMLKAENGELLWQDELDDSGSSFGYSLNLCHCPKAGLFIASTSSTSRDQYPRIVVANIDTASGQIKWIYRYSNPGSFNNFIASLALDEGSVYVLHHGEQESLVTKLGNTGEEIWTTGFDSGYDHEDNPCSIQVDDRGDVFACSTCQDDWFQPSRIDICAVKLNPENGSEEWRTVTSIAEVPDPNKMPVFTHQIAAQSMLFDHNHDLLIFGSSWNGKNMDMFKMGIDRNDGRHKGTRHYDGPAGNHDYLIGAVQLKNRYSFVAIGVSCRYREWSKPLRRWRYILNGGANWRKLNSETNSFDNSDPYNYDATIVRF